MSMLPLLINALLIACIVLYLCKPFRRLVRVTFFSAALMASLIPGSLAWYTASIIGSVSITTLVLMFFLMWTQLQRNPPQKPQGTDLPLLQIVLSVTALVLYPNALGIGALDIYAMGFSPLILSWILVFATVIAISAKQDLLAIVFSFAFLGFTFGVLESDNLWDYLVDPLLAVYCLIRLPRAVREIGRRIMINPRKSA